MNALRAVEDEREISEREYLALLELADPKATSIEKTRYRVPLGTRMLEIDVYPFWSDRAIAEIEVETEQECVTLPDYMKVIAEVTEDVRYKNANLAHSVPNDDISRFL